MTRIVMGIQGGIANLNLAIRVEKLTRIRRAERSISRDEATDSTEAHGWGISGSCATLRRSRRSGRSCI
jgi:hypothetical protein